MKQKIVAGILAHVDTGKTTLSENILYDTGVIKDPGRVDFGNTFLDRDRVEMERGITIYSKNARIPMEKFEMILIDTPGHVDFSPEMERALSVLDLAILLISAPEGVQAHTKTLWKLLELHSIPTFIFVNKMDMYKGTSQSALANISAALSGHFVSFEGENEEAFFEDAATASEDMLEDYLQTGVISDNKLQEAIRERKIFPVFYGSALKNQGIREFIKGLDRYMFTPGYSSKVNEPFSAKVYKLSRDKDQKRLTHIKILSGTLKLKDALGQEKVNEIRIYQGEKYEKVTEAFAGDVCVLAGLNDTQNGRIISSRDNDIPSTPAMMVPVLSYCVRYPEDMDKNRMLEILKQMEEEDPSLNVEYREQTGEIYVSLMGDVQSQVLQRTLLDRFGVKVDFGSGRVCYRETVSESAVGVGHFEPLRHYAEAHIKIEPLDRGSGIEYDTDVSEDFLAGNWQRLILTHLMEREHHGVLTGAPITDVKLTLVAGRAHEKHTEGGDFRQATYRAVRQGMMKLREMGQCHLLEPYYDYTLELPEEYVGRAMTDILKMKGTCRIDETNFEDHMSVLQGRIPVSTMNGYMKEINSYSKGQGRLSLVTAGYFDCHNEEEVLSQTTYDPEGDLRNPPGSVFCAHGAGVQIPWYQVDDMKHVCFSKESGAFIPEDDSASKEANRIRMERDRIKGDERDFISPEEVDALLKSSSRANENGRKASYKGISQASREHRSQNRVIRTDGEDVEYKGSPQRDKYLLVDGYNVIHAWKELSDLAEVTLDGAAGRLNDILCNYQGITGMYVIAVYDAYKVKGHSTEVYDYQNIKVVYTREAQTADQYIERYAHEHGRKHDITVVTSDGLEQIIVTGAGCRIISSREFEGTIGAAFRSYNDIHHVDFK